MIHQTYVLSYAFIYKPDLVHVVSNLAMKLWVENIRKYCTSSNQHQEKPKFLSLDHFLKSLKKSTILFQKVPFWHVLAIPSMTFALV